jgi:crotonobetainyl-CoA:carnitine CoA-transferase CaiB-like acyl-CoA transferase
MSNGEGAQELLLSPYRVLDLTGQGGLLCGKILADLGADVIQVEPPGGSAARNIGPFYQDDVHPEKSLFWWSYSANKRSVTLNLETADGRDLLKRLVKSAHFLIESFPPGYMDSLSLGYTGLEAINPELVMVSITPFGSDGPYAHWKAPDIVGMALGGFMYLTGDSDRPPLRVSIPHFHLHGAAAGAAGAMIAHTHRAITGEGQHVDVSCQQAVAKTLAHAPQSWDLEGVILKRMGVFRQTSGDSIVRTCWPCKDGYINYVLQGGSSGVAASTRTLLAWMDEEDMGDEFLNDVNWEELGYGQVRSEIMEKGVAPLIRFFATHTRQELVAASVERRILLFPVATQQDILDHPQLKARDYFQQLHHPELDTTVNYPGLFVKDRHGERMSLRRRPPLIGEHNREIYQDELGLTLEQVTTLKESGAI